MPRRPPAYVPQPFGMGKGFEQPTGSWFTENSERRLAKARVKRLTKDSNNAALAIFYDVLFAAVPWLIAVAGTAAVLLAVYESDEEAQRIFPQLNAPVALGTISTFAAFLLVSKIQANLACNAKVLAEFGNLTGAVVNLALFVKSQRSTSGLGVQRLTLRADPDDGSAIYQTNRLALVLASVPYVVKYNGRKTKVNPELLPLGQVKDLVQRFEQFTTNTARTNVPMSDFTALVLIISDLIDEIQREEVKDTEYVVLFDQLNALTAAEGTISATAGYEPPYIIDAMLYVVFALFILLLLIGDLIPTHRGNAVWLSALVTFCTAAFFQISDRYWNPMALRSKRSGQAPIVSKMCVATEITVVEIFSKVPDPAKRPAAGASAGALSDASADAAAPLSGLRISFGL